VSEKLIADNLKPIAPVAMKELLLQFAAYNIWANQRIMEYLQQIPEEQFIQEMPSSFKSIHSTLLHMWDAESMWWQRMKLQEVITRPSDNFRGTTRDVLAALLHQNKLWETWIHNASQPALDHVFMYYTTKREPFKQPIFQMLLHVFNHGTYHRGQIINMLRQLGAEKLPQTDFIVFARKK
jgi:uncharacterized damage-inducible protein DinB